MDTRTIVLALLVVTPLYLIAGIVILAVMIDSKMVEDKNEIYHFIFYILWPMPIIIKIIVSIYRKVFKPSDI